MGKSGSRQQSGKSAVGQSNGGGGLNQLVAYVVKPSRSDAFTGCVGLTKLPVRLAILPYGKMPVSYRQITSKKLVIFISSEHYFTFTYAQLLSHEYYQCIDMYDTSYCCLLVVVEDDCASFKLGHWLETCWVFSFVHLILIASMVTAEWLSGSLYITQHNAQMHQFKIYCHKY
jgi:hypothetical protein